MAANRPEARSHDTVGAQRRLPSFDYADSSVIISVTICAMTGTRPFVHSDIAGDVVDSLYWLRANRGLRIYAYCLMPDHLHLLLQLGEGSKPLGDLMADMKRHTTRQARIRGWGGLLWQPRFYDHVLRDLWMIQKHIPGAATPTH